MPILENFNCKLMLQILVKEDVSSERKSPQQYYFKKNGFQHGEKMSKEQDRRYDRKVVLPNSFFIRPICGVLGLSEG